MVSSPMFESVDVQLLTMGFWRGVFKHLVPYARKHSCSLPASRSRRKKKKSAESRKNNEEQSSSKFDLLTNRLKRYRALNGLEVLPEEMSEELRALENAASTESLQFLETESIQDMKIHVLVKCGIIYAPAKHHSDTEF